MNLLNLIKKYKFVLSAFCVAIVIYLHFSKIIENHDAFLLGLIFVLLPLIISTEND